MNKAFALQNVSGSIDVRTVSESERAVMVNAIVTQAKIFVDKSWTDEDIHRKFTAYVRGIVVPVEIHAKE